MEVHSFLNTWYNVIVLQIRVASQHFTICLQRQYDSEFSVMYFTRIVREKVQFWDDAF